MTKQKLIEQHVESSLRRVVKTVKQRGKKYGDTLGECQFVTLKATANHLGITLPDDSLRALFLAGMVDMKYQRMAGGYDPDNLRDGIPYAAALDSEVEAVLSNRKNIK